VSLPQSTLKLLDSIHNEFKCASDSAREICVKTQQEGWVVARKSGERELFALFDAKYSSLGDVQGTFCFAVRRYRLLCSYFSFVVDALSKLRTESFFNTIFLE
jgi:hypothetical protein